MMQRVKDPVLSLQQLGSPLWREFNPWPRNFHMPQPWPKKEKKEKTYKEYNFQIKNSQSMRKERKIEM